MRGRIIKTASDFYYAESSIGIIEAKLRSVLKKRSEEVYTGDIVRLEQIDENSKQAFIAEIMPRTSLIGRPKAANISKVIIVSAVDEPPLDFEQLDRFAAYALYHRLEPVLCFNKEDILHNSELRNQAERIYKPLGWKIFFISALKKTGIEELKPEIEGSVSVLCGVSGAGKSSLINALSNSSKMKTAPVSAKTLRGAHTTRHSELIKIGNNAYIADSPGFSRLKFDFLPPYEVQTLFPEFNAFKPECRYKNCLHTGIDGCSFEHIIKNMPETRYESYKKFVKEAQEYQEKISESSIKDEGASKYNHNKIMAKISERKRRPARNTEKQKLYKGGIDYE